MQTVFIPNRGEVVRRIARTARRLGFKVAVGYSDADAGDPFLAEVDRAIRLGSGAPGDSYLAIDKVVAAAHEVGADLVHPGYGFLAEDPAFAHALARADLRFVGPPPEVLEQVGSKSVCRVIAARLGIPVVPGHSGDQSDGALARAARALGYPLLVKPAAGGGGKGIAVVEDGAGLAESIAVARRVALAAFGDGELLLERYIASVRHVEVQILRERSGTCVVLGDRDCSTQRRHQKLIEESPAPALDGAVRRSLHDSAEALAAHVGYENAGTVEFIVSPEGRYYFLELNPRLQVEHPVTELVFDADVVEQQLRIALGEPISVATSPRGHAIEVRVCAEDPYRSFVPSSGRIVHVRWPARARVDAAFDEGSELSPHYDSLLGKIIAYGDDRESALLELRAALAETSVLGIDTNLPLLRALAAHERLTGAAMTTDFLELSLDDVLPPARTAPEALTLAAAALSAHAVGGDVAYLRDADHAYLVTVADAGSPAAWRPAGADEAHEWVARDASGAAAVTEEHVWVDVGGTTAKLWRTPDVDDSLSGTVDLGAYSPMTGRVASVSRETGAWVTRGEKVLTLEAMKMEMPVVAGGDGTLRLRCGQGDVVEAGQRLFDVETA